jgi:hypothetical protein
MIIVHSEATKDTYVGWVLYQADRPMKGYGQGVDNLTTNDIVARVSAILQEECSFLSLNL